MPTEQLPRLSSHILEDILESNLRIIELLARIEIHLGSQQSHEQFLKELLQPIINVVQEK